VRVKYFFFIIFITNTLVSLSQNEVKIFENISFESDFGYGSVLPHHKAIEYCVEDHIKSFDIRIAKQTIGDKPWHKEYRYPRYGIGYYHSNLSNNLVFGKVNALYSFINIPIINERIFSVNYQISIGMSYINKTFDLETNYENIAIGSKANIYLDFCIQPKLKINDKFSISSNLRFTHFSNGKIVSPNKGINVVSNSLGLYYTLEDTKRNVSESKTFIPNNKITVIYSGAIKSISRYEKGSFYASSISGDYYRQYNIKHQWGIGADVFFDSAIRTAKNLEKYETINNADLYQYGVHVGHDMIFGELVFCMQLGAYLYTPIEPEAPIYNRLGIRYYFNNNIIANLCLKSHYGKASFIEFGVGYCFN